MIKILTDREGHIQKSGIISLETMPEKFAICSDYNGRITYVKL